MRALFVDTGLELTLECIVDDATNTRYDPSSGPEWGAAKNRVYSKALWVAQVYMHLANHLRLAPVAVACWQLPSPEHWLFQLLHPFLSDLPFVNEIWGVNVILEEFTAAFAPDDRHQTAAILRAASRTTEDTRTVLEVYTPCADRTDTFRVYSQVVHDCLRTFVKHVVDARCHTDACATAEDVATSMCLGGLAQLYARSHGLEVTPSMMHREAIVDVLVWVLYEASLRHAIYHIPPHHTMSEQWGHRVVYGDPKTKDYMNTVSLALTFPESVCSLYPLHLDTLGTFRLGTSVDVLRQALRSKLGPYVRDVLCAPETIICTHGH